MSIADDEAEQAYPARYWNGTHVKEQFYCDTDDLQEAYLRGRTAPPADAEVEAVAKRLLWRDTVLVDGNAWPRLSEDDLWNRSIQSTRVMYRKVALGILEIARKAVDE